MKNKKYLFFNKREEKKKNEENILIAKDRVDTKKNLHNYF